MHPPLTSPLRAHGRDFDFAKEPVGRDGGGEFLPEDLGRYAAVVLQVLGQVDERHAVGADLTINDVAAGE